MRLWTLHPKYLDAQGLVALWREALLAQRVLEGRTRGYRSHPQLLRFRESADSLAAISSYLRFVHAEAGNRGYAFNASLISTPRDHAPITVTAGQLNFEACHLRIKLASRNPHLAHRLAACHPTPHPLFRVVPGAIEPWERSGLRASRAVAPN